MPGFFFFDHTRPDGQPPGRFFFAMRSLAGGLLAALLGVAAFGPALGQGWVYDDHPLIEHNPSAGAGGPIGRLLAEPYWPAGRSADKLYRPLTILSFRANAVLGGASRPTPRAVHATNLLLHGLATVLVGLLAARLTGRWPAAWAAAFLFAAHPVQAEAVVTGYGRSELLAGLFAVALLLNEVAGPVEARSWARHLVSGALFAAAVLSKESALALWPAAALLQFQAYRLQRGPAEDGFRRWLREAAPRAQAPFAVVTVVAAVLRWNVLHGLRLPDGAVDARIDPIGAAPFPGALLMPFRLLVVTARAVVDPGALCPVWSVPALVPPLRLHPDVLAGMALAAALAALFVWLWRRRSPLAAVVPGLLCALAVPLHVPHMAHWVFAERWLYTPMALAAVLIGGALAARRLAVAAAVVAALALAPAARGYARAFADDLTMFQEVVRRQPGSYQGRLGIAQALWVGGRPAEAREAALRHQSLFGPTPQATMVMLHASFALGEGQAALVALEQLGRLMPLPPDWVEAQRRQAAALGAGGR